MTARANQLVPRTYARAVIINWNLALTKSRELWAKVTQPHGDPLKQGLYATLLNVPYR